VAQVVTLAQQPYRVAILEVIAFLVLLHQLAVAVVVGVMPIRFYQLDATVAQVVVGAEMTQRLVEQVEQQAQIKVLMVGMVQLIRVLAVAVVQVRLVLMLPAIVVQMVEMELRRQ
jgi:uncharacterized membrane protein YqgA involved in biofilm formation